MFELRQDAQTRDAGSALIVDRGQASALGQPTAGEPARGYGYGSTHHGGMDALRSFLRPLWRYRAMVIVIFLLGSAATMPLIWSYVKPTYIANALIQVEPVGRRVIFETEDVGILPYYRQFVNTQVAMIKSSVVMEKVLLESGVQQTTWYRETPPELRYADLQDRVSARNRRETQLIDVSVELPVKEDAKTIAKAVVEHYFDAKRTGMIAVGYEGQKGAGPNGDPVLQYVLTERDEVQGQIRGLQDRRIALTKPFGITSLAGIQSANQQRKLELVRDLENLRNEQEMCDFDLLHLAGLVEFAKTTALTKSAKPESDAFEPPGKTAVEPGEKDGLGGRQVPAPAAAAAGSGAQEKGYYADREWREWHSIYQQVEAEMNAARAAKLYGEKHPDWLKLAARLDWAQERLAARAAQLEAEGGAPIVDIGDGGSSMDPIASRKQAIEYQKERALKMQEVMEQNLSRLNKEIEELAEVAKSVMDIENEIERQEALLDTIKQRIDELTSQQQVMLDRVRLASPPSVGNAPTNERRYLVCGMAAAAWLGLALALAFLRAQLNPSVDVAEDVAMDVPFLGQLPRLQPHEDVLVETPATLLESVRMIRTSLLERIKGRRGTIILITSPGMASGKTTLSMLLGRSLAQMGKRVLLVDTDLRRAGLSERLGLKGKPGLVEALKGALGGVAKGQPEDRLGVAVVPTGLVASLGDIEQLANGRFQKCMDAWRKEYEIILLDAPPVLPVADARILAAQADATVMVVRLTQTRRQEAHEAFTQLEAVGARVIGSILIGTRAHDPYYYSEYGYYGNLPVEAAKEDKKAASAPAES